MVLGHYIDTAECEMSARHAPLMVSTSVKQHLSEVTRRWTQSDAHTEKSTISVVEHRKLSGVDMPLCSTSARELKLTPPRTSASD